MRETDTHIYFWGSYLSNFAWAPFKCALVQGGTVYEFPTSEHCFMAAKAAKFKDVNIFKQMLKAYDGKAVKALGRRIKNFDARVWDKVSYEKMRHAVYNKFDQNPLMKYDLIETNNKILVEASPLDTIWGVGLHEDDDKILSKNNWRGENRLGKVLMEVRKQLREEDNLTVNMVSNK